MSPAILRATSMTSAKTALVVKQIPEVVMSRDGFRILAQYLFEGLLCLFELPQLTECSAQRIARRRRRGIDRYSALVQHGGLLESPLLIAAIRPPV